MPTAPDKERKRVASPMCGILTGIAFTDEDSIIGYFDVFAQRVHNLIELIETLKQFSQLTHTASGLPILSFETSPDGIEVDYEKISETEEDDHVENVENDGECYIT